MKLKIWINAFIPKTVDNYTKVIAKGAVKGKTAVPLPWQARLAPGNTFKNCDTGYLTDQRGFSSRLNSSVRMRSIAEFTIHPSRIELNSSFHYTSGTTAVDMETGEKIDSGSASMSRCKWSRLRIYNRYSYLSPGGGRFRVRIPASNPKIPSYWITVNGQESDPLVDFSADINYRAKFNLNLYPSRTGIRNTLSVDVLGYIDAFPAFECYASLNGAITRLFAVPPPPGNTVMNLLGEADKPITGRAVWSWNRHPVS